MKKKSIACVILNYNDAEETGKYTAWAQKLGLYDALIVVDNRSPDGSYEKLKKLEKDNIYVFQTEKNGGYGYGNNYGIRIAKEQFHCDIAFISNPDVSYTRSCAKKMIQYLSDHSDCGLIAPVQYNGFTRKIIHDVAWKIPSFTSYVWGSLFFLRRLVPNQHYVLTEEYQKVDCVPGAFLAVNIENFWAANGYDERIFLYCEESTLGYRLKQHGYYSCLATKERYYHFVSTSIKKSIPNIVTRQNLIFSSRFFYLKNYLHVNPGCLWLAKMLFFISLAEEWLKKWIRKI